MICKNCGTKLPGSSKICTKCGTPTSAEEMNISAAGVERAVPKVFSVKKNIIIIIIAAILLIGGGATAIAVVNSHSASSGVADKLQLAERYLNEQNYEQAIIEYQKVLEIEPMNVDAYLGLADAYLGMGDKDKALEWRNKGYEQTGDARIQARIDELTMPVEPEVSELEISKPSEPTISEPEPAVIEPTEPVYGSMGFVTILDVEYDVATTTYLNLSLKGITDAQLKVIAPDLANLTNLTELWLSGNHISDITPIENLTRLKVLYLNDNLIGDLTPLANLTNLTDLDLRFNQISNIMSLKELENLTELSLTHNQISDISPLESLTNLKYLDLGTNQVNDIAPLANLTNLVSLDLFSNKISYIIPLTKLSKLTYLNLIGNQINDDDKEKLKTQLLNCYIDF